MKSILHKSGITLLITAFIILALTSCKKEQVPIAKQDAQSSSDQNNDLQTAPRTFQYLVGVDPIEGPDISVAEEGDTIAIAGSGTFTLSDYSITGNGWYMHTTKDGAHHQKG